MCGRQQRSLAFKLFVVAHTASILPLAMPASAQGQLEEIVITAQKREQNLQDVGVSVTAMNAEQLRDRGVFRSTDIQKIAPGVIFAAGASGDVNSTLSMRGVTQSAASSHIEQPNAVYLDEIYMSSPSSTAFSLYDLNRIEVLRGPQGTLFGRNATGGLVHFITERPTEEFEGYSELGYGAFNQVYGEGAVSGPLSDRVRGRLAGRAEQADGWWRNRRPGGEDVFEKEFWGLRGQLEFDVSPDLIARVALNYEDNPRSLAGTYKSQNYYVQENGLPARLPADVDAFGTGPGNNVFGYRDPYSDAQEGSFNNSGYIERESDSETLELKWNPGEVDVTSLTNRTKFKMDYGPEDFDGSPIEYATGPLVQDLTQWSQELRATGDTDLMTWTTGVFYLDIDQTGSTGFNFPVLSGTDFAFNSFNDIEQTTETYAVFGQAEWNLSEKLLLTTGARYTHDEIKFKSLAFYNELGNGYDGGTGSTVFDPPLLVADFQASTVGGLATQSEGLWSGKLQLDYTVADDNLVYGSVSRGVKGPGFNSNIDGSLPNDSIPFDSESMIAYELGNKAYFMDRRLRVNSGAYFYDYKDFQGFAFVGTQGQVSNYDGEYYGGELEISAILPADVTANLGVSYIHSELSDVPTTYYGVTSVRGNLAAEWLANGSIEKVINIGSDTLELQWSFDYLGDRYSSVDNNRISYINDSFLHDARVTYKFYGGIEIAAYVTNISDEEREVFNYDFVSSGYRMVSYAPPRWWGVSIRKDF